MPQFERRLYDPADEVRVYDGGEDDYADEGSRLPLLIVIALVVLASFAGVVWLAYTQGVQRGRQDAPRIVAAEPAQKVAGEQKNPYSGLQIYQPPKPDSESTNAAPQPTAGAPPRKSAATSANKAAQTLPVMHPAIAAPKPAVAPPRTITALIESQQKNTPAAQKPIPSPVKPMPPPPAQTAALQSAPAPQGGGGFVLQIGSYPSEADANASWQTYKSTHAAVASYVPDVQKADLGSKGTWYRLRVGPFASLSEASAACARLKAQGGSCFPAKR